MFGKRKVDNGYKVKQYFFGVEVYKQKYMQEKTLIYFLGIPVFKIKKDNEKIKVYLFSVKLFSCRNFKTFEPSNIPNTNNILNIKTFELINSRKNCICEKETFNENII